MPSDSDMAHTVCHIRASTRQILSSGFQQSEIQTSLFSYKDKLENQNFACSKSRYNNFQKANNKCVDQTAWMSRLVCAFVVR